MSLLSGAVGRKTRETAWATKAIYTVLTLGGITMIYPFLVMISGSFKSEVDLRDWDVIPKYFYSDKTLYRKYVESKFNESVALWNSLARQDEYSFTRVEPPTDPDPRLTADWYAFLAEADLPRTWFVLGHSFSVNNRMYPVHARGFRRTMVAQCDGKIAEFHRRYGSLAATWLNVAFAPPISPADRAWKITGSPLQAESMRYSATAPPRDLVLVSLDGRWANDFLQLKYGKKVADLNAAHGARYKTWDDVRLPQKAPAAGRARTDWLEFVRGELNLQFVRVAPSARGAYARFLSSRYEGRIAGLNRAYEATYPSFAAVPFPTDTVTVGSRLVDWELFVREAPPAALSVDGPEFRWRAWLRARRADPDPLTLAAAPLPQREAAWAEVRAHPVALRWEFATRNYRHVFEYLALHGRGLWNTLIFCLLSIVSVLIVNPVAAYAMSRYNLPSAYKILLFLLATIAFPPMVTAIPNFLLLKELGLLNTFAALILPGMVNGYAIFLLKGFFDSLPRELYEAAQLDGAGEWTMFWGMTMFLSKPILAVITLDAFNAAYGAFVYAFIVCQDEKMWTLGVWLYQLQQYAHQSVTFAALLVASIPTFLVFLFAQRLILRGIVIPVEK